MCWKRMKTKSLENWVRSSAGEICFWLFGLVLDSWRVKMLNSIVLHYFFFFRVMGHCVDWLWFLVWITQFDSMQKENDLNLRQNHLYARIALNHCWNWRNHAIPVICWSRSLIWASPVFCVTAETGWPSWGCNLVAKKKKPVRVCFKFTKKKKQSRTYYFIVSPLSLPIFLNPFFFIILWAYYSMILEKYYVS